LSAVDVAEKLMAKKIANSAFNGDHVAAIARISGCRLIALAIKSRFGF
jgi:hypothetical protein